MLQRTDVPQESHMDHVAQVPQPPAATLSSPPTYQGRPLARPDDEVVDQGLRFDIETLVDRRRALQLFGYAGLSAGVVTLAACAPAATGSPVATMGATSGAAATAAGAECAPAIPEETAGPYPGDGSNGPDVLSESGVVRSDIRSSFGEFSGTAEGVPMTIKLAIQDAANGCAPYAGAAVYVWHCDREARYSLYSQGATDQNYLRGVQAAGADGVVTFQSIFPACYSGRWPHIHFEVYPSLAAATDDANVIATSQVALPEDACDAVYATTGYEASIQNLGQVSLATDNVFRDDGGARQLGTVSGSVESGYTVELAVPVGA
jgi:protocatechuate 3,4-dioxygenase beta subunit